MNYLSVNWIVKRFGKVPLQTLLIVPFVLQIVGVVALVGYLSYRSGKVAVENLADKLMDQTAQRISDRLDTSLHSQQQALAVNRLDTQLFASATTLSDISTFLSQLKFSPSGQTFILEHSGDLVATSTLEIPLIKHDKKPPMPLSATQSQDARTKAVAVQLQQQYGDLKQIRASQHLKVAFQGETLFAHIDPYGDEYSLDWLLVTVIPASDFMGEIQANTKSTILLCGLTLVAVTGMGILTAGWITRPIIQISRASQALADGKWQEPLPDNEVIAELQILAISFNRMGEQLQKAIQKSEEKFAKVLCASPDPITIINLTDGSYLAVNDQFLTLTGYTNEEVIGHTIDELNLIVNSQQAQEIYHHLQTQQTIHNYEMEWRSKSGEIKTGLLSSELIELEDEILMLSVFKDISNVYNELRLRQKAEADLRESNHFIQQVTDYSPQILYILNPITWTNLYVNRQSIEILGYTPEEFLLGGSQFLLDIVHPEDFPLLSRNMAQWQIAHDGEILTTEYRMRHKNGSWCWLRSRDVVFARDENNQVIKILGTAQDISESKQVEAALKQAHNQITFHIENTPLATIIWNNQFQVQEWSKQAEKIFGWSAAEVLNKTMLDWQFIFEEDLDQVKFETERLISKESSSICNNRNYRKDGSVIHCQWFNSNLFDESGNLVSILSFAQDVSDRVQAELELQQAKEAAEAANHAKSAFLANMSHELRTPLNAILGFAQLINWDSTLLPEHQEQVKLIYNSGEHLLKLINEVLELSKIEAGIMTLDKKEIDLLELLDSLNSMFNQQVRNKKLQLHQEILPGVPQYIIVDAQKLQQILINLIGNAIKFTQKGNIYLSVSLANQPTKSNHELNNLSYIQFKVIDTGVGIAPQYLDIIFDAFTQAPAGQQCLQEGTGLGLTISRRLVQLMGGEIMLNSTLGQGSTFQFSIPVLVVTGSHIQPRKPTQRVTGLAPNQPNYRILVVDDQILNRLFLVKLLGKLKLEVQEAVNGEEAISLWEQWQPHLIFMDIRMPGWDGYEVTKQIRAIEQPDHSTIIIALTAQASNDDSKEQNHHHLALEAGCNDYISKPFRAETLFSKMAEHLDICYTYDNPASPPLVFKQALTAEDLAVMPQAWVVELRQASVSCEQTTVEQLIKQIPPQHSSLALSLDQLTQNFAFEQIIKLAQTYLCGQNL
ncbi:PAS domain S-box protein [Anabaena cylindrica UHCC 0172]|uniref:PAS domain S-box protein n=1 Tax=Anabaena cylindrica TaxID=1165 RepID=UPI002B200782|nr:PAS domain S-box protein [Anabaena cylindrica]MEA5551574.1 PAS domain S-box protein [Anabaena cylindrica UHCC 0172]